ncbi:MAG: AMP phosphorylase [Methanobacteriota archaeon]
MYKVKEINIDAGEHTVILNERDAKDLGVRSLDRVRVFTKERTVTAIVETSKEMIAEGEAGLLCATYDAVCPNGEKEVDILPADRPESVDIIKKKLEGQTLTPAEIRTLVKDMVNHNLSDIELTAYVVANQVKPMNLDEITELTKAMVETGDTIEFDKRPIFDFHSIGGAPGNKITMLVVPIVAAAGLHIPKTCSRAISSAGGTADIFEVLCNVNQPKEKIKSITETIGGVIVWGGSVNMAPADDIIIRVEYPLSIDPYSQVIASVMAKKKAVGADYFLLDIPTGPNTKVPDMKLARSYAHDFIEVGRRLGMKVECAITYGGQPIGTHIGPAAEAKEALMVLEGKADRNSTSVLEKACAMAGLILEMGGAAHGNGKQMAKESVASGTSLAKLREIIAAQGGNPDVKSEDVSMGKFKLDIVSRKDGYVTAINNKYVTKIVRAAGAPKDKGAGMILEKKRGHKVEHGEVLFTVFSDNQRKLDMAKAVARRFDPMTVEGIVLEHIPGNSRVVEILNSE